MLSGLGSLVLKSMREEREARKAAAASPSAVVERDTMPDGFVTFKAISCDDLGIITGIGGAAGSPSKLDLDEEYLEKGDLMKLAFDFCAKGGSFNANHSPDHLIEADLVQSWVGAPIIELSAPGSLIGVGMKAQAQVTRMLGPNETLTPEMKVVGINVEKGNESHWFLSVRPKDAEIVKAAREGKISGFSWEATVVKTDV